MGESSLLSSEPGKRQGSVLGLKSPLHASNPPSFLSRSFPTPQRRESGGSQSVVLPHGRRVTWGLVRSARLQPQWPSQSASATTKPRGLGCSNNGHSLSRKAGGWTCKTRVSAGLFFPKLADGRFLTVCSVRSSRCVSGVSHCVLCPLPKRTWSDRIRARPLQLTLTKLPL